MPRTRAAQAYIDTYFDRSHTNSPGCSTPTCCPTATPPPSSCAPTWRPTAPRRPHADLRLDTHATTVDDPVKRVHNMTMDWGLQARAPFLDHVLVELAAACPPELKLADGGKGVLKAAGRKVLPRQVVDRPKGYFPVPAIKHMAGPVLQRVREALTAPEARARGVFRQEYVTELLTAPTRTAPGEGRTRCGKLRCWRYGCRRTESADGSGAGHGGRRPNGAGPAHPAADGRRRCLGPPPRTGGPLLADTSAPTVLRSSPPTAAGTPRRTPGSARRLRLRPGRGAAAAGPAPWTARRCTCSTPTRIRSPRCPGPRTATGSPTPRLRAAANSPAAPRTPGRHLGRHLLAGGQAGILALLGAWTGRTPRPVAGRPVRLLRAGPRARPARPASLKITAR
ncbi:hypothetical protein SGRIM128S_01003 [Streptomyces griseomycini]